MTKYELLKKTCTQCGENFKRQKLNKKIRKLMINNE